MANLLLILKFFAGLLIVFASGWLVAFLFKLENNVKKNDMKNKMATSFILLATTPASNAAVSNGTLSYLFGGIVAFLIMVYLVYTLLKPEKF
jgi:K+-transporting ATPase KdpF subunit